VFCEFIFSSQDNNFIVHILLSSQERFRPLTFSISCFMYSFILLKQEQTVVFYANLKITENVMEITYNCETFMNVHDKKNNYIENICAVLKHFSDHLNIVIGRRKCPNTRLYT
jgi:hypothetical protein